MATLAPGEKGRFYALGGVARGGATRGGYIPGHVYVAIDGSHVGHARAGAAGILLGSLTITDTLDETPTRCTFVVNGQGLTTGGEVVVQLGSKNTLTRLFAGYITATNQVYVGDKPANVQTEVAAVDYTWMLGFVKVTGRYTSQSATAIIADLVTRYGAVNGFTSKHVMPGLPPLDEITFTEEELPDAITRIMRRVGGYWYADYHLHVHAWTGEETQTNGAPESIVPGHRSLAKVAYTLDRSQVLTRVSVEGRGSRLLSAVALGDTRIPLDTVEMFEPAADVYLKASFQGAEGGAQYLSFNGRSQGGAGSLVGPGIAPPGAPTASLATGTGLSIGRYSYAYTFKTAAGETLPSPLAVIDVGVVIPAPTVAPTQTPQVSATGVDLGAHSWAYTYLTSGGGETTLSPVGTAIVTQGPVSTAGGIFGAGLYLGGVLPNGTYTWRATYLGNAGGETTAAQYDVTFSVNSANNRAALRVDAKDQTGFDQPNTGGVVGVKIYRSKVRPVNTPLTGTLYFVGNAVKAGDGFYDFSDASTPDASLGAPIPTTNTGLQRMQAVEIRTTASPTPSITAVRIYRTAAAGGGHRLVAQVATTAGAAVTYLDTTADASLGANAPLLNTAGNETRSVALSIVAVGPAGVTARWLYRTAANGAQLRGIGQIADNVGTTFTDSVPDAGLGTFVPTGDTSGLTQTTGQVAAGSLVIPVANAAVFDPAGGWAIIGNGEQVIRYTGTTSTSLTGIPATGIGAITATVVFGSTITGAPMLTGVGGITGRALTAGDEIYLVVQVDDATRRGALAADLHRGDGIRTLWLQDRRLSVTEARARGQATLAIHPLDEMRVTYSCRDLRTAPGKTVTVNLPPPTNIVGQFRIQQMTVANFRTHPTQYPTYTVDASTRLFSFEDWLRRIKVSN